MKATRFLINLKLYLSEQVSHQEYSALSIGNELMVNLLKRRLIMWYFAWILGVLLAISFGIINAMWLESDPDFDLDNDQPQG